LHKIIPRAICAALVVCLCACAAREFSSEAMVQPGDNALTCPEIKQQIAVNEAAGAQFRKEDKAVSQGNIAKGVAGAIPVAGILIVGSTDLSNEEQVKARALADRNERLDYLAKQKNCSL
jgi:hypothetical protein